MTSSEILELHNYCSENQIPVDIHYSGLEVTFTMRIVGQIEADFEGVSVQAETKIKKVEYGYYKTEKFPLLFGQLQQLATMTERDLFKCYRKSGHSSLLVTPLKFSTVEGLLGDRTYKSKELVETGVTLWSLKLPVCDISQNLERLQETLQRLGVCAPKKPCYNFSLVCVQHDDGRFLLIKETRNRGWWLPGGKVEPGESFETAAVRETLEEGGIPVVLKGILRIDHTPKRGKMRVIFYAKPADTTPPKSVADKESVEAKWMTLEELEGLHMRGREPEIWFKYITEGGIIHPLNLLTEGQGF